ncbi:MAG TPA: hypothetical protein VFO30_07580 [Chthoniobacterales bacterium]|nr:hypothetical protein [Chthoniobacterales bacterium]
MEEFDDKEIATLLRLKRYEQPPPGYFEDFLHEFHRRQRDALLCEPLWRICLHRTHDFFLRLNVFGSTGSYATAAAAVLVCAAVISLKMYQPSPPASVAARADTSWNAPANLGAEWTLASPVAERLFSAKPLRKLRAQTHSHDRGTPPRYVLDSVPVSYETTVRF